MLTMFVDIIIIIVIIIIIWIMMARWAGDEIMNNPAIKSHIYMGGRPRPPWIIMMMMMIMIMVMAVMAIMMIMMIMIIMIIMMTIIHSQKSML